MNDFLQLQDAKTSPSTAQQPHPAPYLLGIWIIISSGMLRSRSAVPRRLRCVCTDSVLTVSATARRRKTSLLPLTLCAAECRLVRSLHGGGNSAPSRGFCGPQEERYEKNCRAVPASHCRYSGGLAQCTSALHRRTTRMRAPLPSS